jgi:putative sigma-54 modulation protein
MRIETDIVFRDMDSSEAVKASVEKHVEKIERHFPAVSRCRAVIEQSHKSQSSGNLFHVGLDISVPGDTVVVTKDAGKKPEHEDVYVAIRDAFEAAERQLSRYTAKRHQH